MWTHDLRYAFRLLAGSPGFTLVAIVTLALGIGANTAIFTVLDVVLLRPLPYAEPSDLVTFSPGRYDSYRVWTEGVRSLDSSGAYTFSVANVTDGSEPVRVWTLAVTSRLLPTLGVTPLLGRGFSSEDDLPGAPPRVLLRHGFWQTQFGGEPGLVGRTIDLDGRAHEVIGILPGTLEFPPPVRRADGSMPRVTDVWTGVGGLSDLHERGGFYAIARLAHGSSAQRAAAELSGVANAAEPRRAEPIRVNVQHVTESVVAPLRPALLAFTGAVVLVLLIACANLGSLLLARLARRRRDLALRVALGASAGRIVRELLTEGAVLAFGGALTGIGIAWLLLRALLALAPAELARVQPAALNGRALAFTLTLAVATTLLIALLPALRALRRDSRESLGSTVGGTADRTTGRMHATLVASEVAFAVVLLIVGGLLLRSFATLASISPGFSADGLVTADLLIPDNRYATRPAVLQFFDRLEERIAALPGVRSVSAIDRLPYGPSSSQIGFRIAGRAASDRETAPRGFNTAVRPGYFQTMGIPILQGREFTRADGTETSPVVVIAGALARRYWPGANPLGARINVFGREREIIGVAGDVRHFGPATPVDPLIYLPQSQDATTRRAMTVVVRTDSSPQALLAAVRAEIRALDAQLPVSNLRSFGALRSERTASQRFNALLVASFAALAVLLAAVGIYGVMSFIVARRTREIGIRVALGARPAAVLRLVVAQGMALAFVGGAIGLVGAWGLTRLIDNLLFGVTPTDPATFVLAPAGLALVAFTACYLPARRAMRVDPVKALRAD